MPHLRSLILAVALAAVPAAGVLLIPAEACANEREIAVGTELLATSDVTLHKAEISKGSRVSVTNVSLRDGRVDGVSVALADGHVVKMTMNQVHTFFRVVGE